MLSTNGSRFIQEDSNYCKIKQIFLSWKRKGQGGAETWWSQNAWKSLTWPISPTCPSTAGIFLITWFKWWHPSLHTAHLFIRRQGNRYRKKQWLLKSLRGTGGRMEIFKPCPRVGFPLLHWRISALPALDSDDGILCSSPSKTQLHSYFNCKQYFYLFFEDFMQCILITSV